MDGLLEERFQNISRHVLPGSERFPPRRRIWISFIFLSQLVPLRRAATCPARFIVAERNEGSSGLPLHNGRGTQLADGSTACQADVRGAHCLRGFEGSVFARAGELWCPQVLSCISSGNFSPEVATVGPCQAPNPCKPQLELWWGFQPQLFWSHNPPTFHTNLFFQAAVKVNTLSTTSYSGCWCINCQSL